MPKYQVTRSFYIVMEYDDADAETFIDPDKVILDAEDIDLDEWNMDDNWEVKELNA